MPSNFNHPGLDGSMDLGFGPDPQRANPDNLDQGSASGSVTLSQEQFDALLQRLHGSQERDYADALGEQVQFDQQPQALPPLVDLSQLPNPQQDPQGFTRGLNEVLNQAGGQLMASARQAAVEQQNQASVLDTAWSMFQENYPEAAEHNELIQLAASREMDALRARGLDPMAVLANNMEGFVDTVAQRTMASINRIRGVSADEADEADNARGEVLAGGTPRPSRPNAGREQGKPSNLVDELKSIQRAMGIY